MEHFQLEMYLENSSQMGVEFLESGCDESADADNQLPTNIIAFCSQSHAENACKEEIALVDSVLANISHLRGSFLR